MNKAIFSHVLAKFVLDIDILKNKFAGKNGNGLKLKLEIVSPDTLLRFSKYLKMFNIIWDTFSF